MAETVIRNEEYLNMEGLQLYDSLIKAKIATDINTNKYDDTALKAKVTTNEAAITTLNGEGEGSVKKQVDDAVARIIADAPEAYDTLKEISDWISSHANDASAMNSQINTNKAEIVTLKTLIGTLPEGSASTTIVTYIAEVIGASQTDLTRVIAIAKSEAISTATADSKTYTDSKVKELTDGQVATNKTDIESLKTKMETFESVTYTPITKLQINSLFSD